MQKYILHFTALLLILTSACNNNEDEADAYGNFEAIETTLSSEVPGKLLLKNSIEGDQVEKDQVLAIIDTTRIVLELKQLQASKVAVASKVKNVRAQGKTLKEQRSGLQTTYKRILKLKAGGSVSQQKVDEVENKINVIETQLSTLETQIDAVNNELRVLDAKAELLQEQYKKCFIKSPVSATVLNDFKEVGELCPAGQPLYHLADLSSLVLKAYISGGQLQSFKIGDKVNILTDKNDEEFSEHQGIVTWISSEAEFTPKMIQTREERLKLVYAIKIRVPNDGSLKIGMPAEVYYLSE